MGKRGCYLFFQAEDGIRGLVRSRGLGDVYKRQELADRLEDVQEAVVAAPARAQEVVIDLRERYTARVDNLVDRFEVRTADLRKTIEDAIVTVRERVGL